MSIIHDEEFGKITIRRSARSTQVRIRVAPDGSLRASIPLYAPVFLVKRLVKLSRSELREIIQKSYKPSTYDHNKLVGKSHKLIVEPSLDGELSVRRHEQRIVVKLPEDKSLSDNDVAKQVTEAVISALRLEAKSYLPKRLSYIAAKLGLKYKIVRFSHAGSRWGSCSSNGTISLNIALMKLPFELIDYVLIHELSHTVHMNHSSEFWSLVERADPNYKQHRKILKSETPSL